MKLANVFIKVSGLTLLLLSFGITPSQATKHSIHFSGTSFTPNTLNVSVGDTIVWSGNFGFHEIEYTHGDIPNGAATFGPSKSTDLNLIYVVTLPGHYGYQCNIHVAMGMIGSFDAATAGVANIASNDVASLEENFPNPFNESTTIRYKLHKASSVTLTIFDINGKEVATPVNKFQNAGTYEIPFGGSSLSSGTFISQLQTGEAILRRQMILIKK